MSYRLGVLYTFAAVGGAATLVAAAQPLAAQTVDDTIDLQPAAALAGAAETAEVRALLEEVIAANPDLAAARRRAAAAAARPAQASALPDPTAGATAFVLPPETRAGAQRLAANVSQGLPWPGTLRLRGKAAEAGALAAAERAEALALARVTTARRLLARLAYVDAALVVVDEDVDTLDEFEQLARTRYETGGGPSQSVVKLQAEITRAGTRRLELRARRAALVAELNALRDRRADAPVPAVRLAPPPALALERPALRARALELRPELAAAAASVKQAATEIDLAELAFKPGFNVGLTYALVERRDDLPAGAPPVPDAGDDVIGVTAMVTLPIWRDKLRAGVREAVAERQVAEQQARALRSEIQAQLDDLLDRIPLIAEQWELFDTVLLPQARESLRSAKFGYETGRQDVLDLLDAERVLLETRLGAQRALADLRVALVDLEGTVGAPLASAAATAAPAPTPENLP
jgi:outer membrane protein TolC